MLQRLDKSIWFMCFVFTVHILQVHRTWAKDALVRRGKSGDREGERAGE
jgi:hypothetical protein